MEPKYTQLGKILEFFGMYFIAFYFHTLPLSIFFRYLVVLHAIDMQIHLGKTIQRNTSIVSLSIPLFSVSLCFFLSVSLSRPLIDLNNYLGEIILRNTPNEV